jgi:hypothetical protein
VICASALCLAGVSGAARGESGATPDVVRQLAPVVYLFKGPQGGRERYLPIDAGHFIKQSALKWHRPQVQCLNDTLASVGKIAPAALGAGDRYFDQVSHGLLCKRQGRRFGTTDFTRPFEGQSGDQGFFLDFKGSATGEAHGPWPVYYEYVPGHFVTYWFFYAQNRPVKVGEGVASHIRLSEDVDFLGVHQGDWEHIAIRLQGTKPIEIDTYAHGKSSAPTDWGSVHREGTHPIIYSAQGSHASYLTVGDHHNCMGRLGCIVDPTGRGTRWDTSTLLSDARGEPWYGFGGGWGKVGPWFHIASIPFHHRKDMSGPLGPSRWKTEVAPASW